MTRNVTGPAKKLFIARLMLGVFKRYCGKVLRRDMPLTSFVPFLRRMLYFLGKLQHNKFVSLNGKTRLDLYIPGYPSRAFFTACDKFTVFNQRLPCATALISLTSACGFRCKHCYQGRDRGRDVDLRCLLDAVTRLQDMGVAFFNIEGGEPFLVYDRLRAVCAGIDNRSEIWINSTGDHMDRRRLQELKELGVTAIMFSLHSPDPDQLNAFMGRNNAWAVMERGVALCHDVGLAVAFNTCLQRQDFYNGVFEQVMEKAKEFKACLVQLIHPKRAGIWLENGPTPFSADDIGHVKKLVARYNQHTEYKNYPAISAQIVEESPEMFGCTAGGIDRFYINAQGEVQPCEFLNISFGNIAEEDFTAIFQRMRDVFSSPGQTWLCEKHAPEIARLYRENGLQNLPLRGELSRRVYQGLAQGEPTELYERMERKQQVHAND